MADSTTPSPRNKTLLLVFIHGFKGDDNTFLDFPAHLSNLLRTHPTLAATPSLTIKPLVYPAFETRGDLAAAALTFREWLMAETITAEVANAASVGSTADPSVRVVLVGHSMGGIVAAEAVQGIARDSLLEVAAAANENNATSTDTKGPTDSDEGTDTLKKHDTSTLFPCVQAVLAFDTPYLGLAPGVFAHGAEDHWAAGKKWFEAASGLFAAGGSPGGAGAASKAAGAASAPASPTSPVSPTEQQPASGWGRWGKMAMMAGGAALMAGGAATALVGAAGAAWAGGANFGDGWGWVTSHLQFVGCLAKREELRRRVEGLVELEARFEVRSANVYTALGEQVEKGGEHGPAGPTWDYKAMLREEGGRRTFCILPGKKWVVQGKVLRDRWIEARNDKAQGEIEAHMYMFSPETNTAFEEMGRVAGGLVAGWLDKKWLMS